MNEVMKLPQEGDLHSVVTIGNCTVELRYGFSDECDRHSGEPYILYPDFLNEPQYTEDGHRIIAALQSVCKHYEVAGGNEYEDCCYTCCFYLDPVAEISVCKCEQMRMLPEPVPIRAVKHED